jgi:hypothetical protein
VFDTSRSLWLIKCVVMFYLFGLRNIPFFSVVIDWSCRGALLDICVFNTVGNTMLI